jgi:hypothetical protein
MNPICQLKQLHTLHIVNTAISALVLGKSSGIEQKGVIETGIAQKNFAQYPYVAVPLPLLVN